MIAPSRYVRPSLFADLTGYTEKAVRRAGVRYRRPYQTRHTYGSMMISAGEHPAWVAQQMGHSDWTITARVYARWMPQAAPDAGQKAVRIFGGNVPPVPQVGKKAQK